MNFLKRIEKLLGVNDNKKKKKKNTVKTTPVKKNVSKTSNKTTPLKRTTTTKSTPLKKSTTKSTPLNNQRENKYVRTTNSSQMVRNFKNNKGNRTIEDVGKELKSGAKAGAYIGKKTGNEAYGGLAGIEQAGSSEIVNALQKGQKSKKKGASDTLQTFAEASFMPIHMLNSTIEAGKNFAKSKKSTKDKLINLGLDLSESMINTKGIELAGKLAPKKVTKEAIKTIKEADEFVSKPYEKNAEKLNEESANYGQGTNFVADTMGVVGRMAPSIGATALTKNPNVGLVTMGVSAKGSSTKEALNKGADLDTATKIGTAKGLIEVGTERLTGGLHYLGKGSLDDIAEKGIQKTLSKVGGQGVKRALLDKGLHGLYDVLGENLEETITDIVDTQIDKATVDPKAKYTLADWGQTTALTTASTIVLNLLTRGMVGGVRVDMDKAINQTENQLNTKFTDKEKNLLKDNALKDLMYKNAYDKANNRIQENKKLINKKVQEAMTLNQNKTLNTTEAQRNKINDAINIKTAEIQALKQQNKLLTDRLENNENFNSLGRYKSNDSRLAQIEQAIPSEMYDTPINIEAIEQNQYDNDSRVANLLVSARQNLNNSEASQSFVKMLSNLAENKGYNIVFNPDMGENINGRIVTNENAKTIELNPNSDKSATFVLMHELSHDIGTQEISEDINNFRGENAIFNEWYEKRSQLYREQTNLSEEEIQEEMMCDSIGELLGNEEYLNHLTTKPTLMQKIMDWINKFLGRTEKGSQEYNYLQQLKQDFERAYNGETQENNTIKNSTELSTKDSRGKTLSKQQQEYFKNSKVRDENGNLLRVYRGRNNEYTVFDREKAGTKGTYYGAGFYFTNDSNEASFYGDVSDYYLNMKNPYLPSQDQVLDEFGLVDFAKSFYDDFEERFENQLPNNWKNAKNIEKGRIVRDILEKNGYDGVINGTNYVVFNSNQIKNIDNTNPTTNDDIRYSRSLKETNTGKDSDGNKLSKQQQKYFENTKVLDDNGNLLTVYHTTTDEIAQFNEFNPVGTQHYRFGDQVVNYYTDSQDMSGSYANQDYKIADTKKITNMQQAKKVVEEYDNGEGTITLEKTKKGYKLVNNLYKNAYEKAKQIWENDFTTEEKQIEKDYEELYKRYVSSGYDNNLVPEFTSLEKYAKDYSQKLDNVERKMTPDEKNIFTEIRRGNDGNFPDYIQTQPVILGEYENETELYRNLKQDIQKSDSDNKNRYQYRGYVNITNPYVIDALGSNWSNITSTKDIDRSVIEQAETIEKELFKDDVAKREIFELWQESRTQTSYESQEFFMQNIERVLEKNNINIKNVKLNNLVDTYQFLYNMCSYGNILYDSQEQLSESIKRATGEISKTNDIVKRVLEANQSGANYDGIIITNVYDYGGKSKYGHTTANNLYVTFNSNQFKAMDNKTPTNDSDIRYSQNLNEEEINKLAKELDELDPEVMAQAFLEKEGNKLKDVAKESGYNLTDKQIKQLYRQNVSKTDIGTLKRIVLEAMENRNYEIDRIAKITKNKNIKILGDHINNMQGEIETNLNTAQIDGEGNVIGESLSDIFAPYTKAKEDVAFNDYLFHKSNIERHKNGVGSQVPMEDSQQLVKAYEEKYPNFKKGAEKVNNYNRNLLKRQVESGLISQDTADNITSKYDFYVPFYENQYLDDNYVPSDKVELKSGNTLRRAQGGADANLLLFQDAMAKQTQQAISNINKNELYKEIVNTLPKKAIDVMENVNPDEFNALVKEGKKHYLTAFENGTPVQVEISQELFNELNKTFENQLKSGEHAMRVVWKPIQKLNDIKRNLVTTWSPSFVVTNALKDIQDAYLNTKYTKDFAKAYPTAIKEMVTGKDTSGNLQKFLNMYGKPNIMGDYSLEGVDADVSNLMKNGKVNNSALVKLAKKIPQINEIIEMIPRYTEYLASLENGCSQKEALYNAREVTVNFGRGGYFAKALNRNGMTFFNAQIQGFSKFFRNFHDAPVRTTAKATAYGLTVALINQLMHGDDDDYDLLPDYIKDNYYLFKVSSNEELKAMPKDMKEKYLIKKGKATFIRIPRGRMLSIFSSMINRGKDRAQGKRGELTLGEDIKSWFTNATNQVGLPDIGSSNLFAPFIDSAKNKTWYGGQLVPDRLLKKDGKKLPATQQYDASTDKISIWLGQKTGISPYKINYILDQYTGGIGDMLIPLITEEAQSSSNGALGMALAPLKDKFTADTINDNKNVTNFYSKAEKLGEKSNELNATGRDKLKSGYMDNVSYQMGALYKQIRDVQADKNLSKKEKYERYEVLKSQINELAKNGLENVNKVKGDEYYGEVEENGKTKQLFRSAKGNYYELYDNQKEALDKAKLSVKERNNLYKTKDEISKYLKSSTDKNKYSKRYAIIKDSNNSQSAKAVLYNQNKQFYQKDPTPLVKDNLVDSFLDIESQNIKSDYKNGKIVYNSKRNKIAKAINKLDLSAKDKQKLYDFYYPSKTKGSSSGVGSKGSKRGSSGSKKGSTKGSKRTTTTKTPKITRTKVTPVKLSNKSVKLTPVKAKSTSNNKYYQEALKNLLFKKTK